MNEESQMQNWFRHARYLAVATGLAAAIGCGCKARRAAGPIDDNVIRLEEAGGPAWDQLPESKDGPERLIGVWEVVRSEAGGFAYPERALAQMRRDQEFRGVNELKFALGPCWCQVTVDDDNGKPMTIQLPVAVHPEQSPHQFKSVSANGEVVEGIYKLTTDGCLLIAIRDDEGRFQPTTSKL